MIWGATCRLAHRAGPRPRRQANAQLARFVWRGWFARPSDVLWCRSAPRSDSAMCRGAARSVSGLDCEPEEKTLLLIKMYRLSSFRSPSPAGRPPSLRRTPGMTQLHIPPLCIKVLVGVAGIVAVDVLSSRALRRGRVCCRPPACSKHVRDVSSKAEQRNHMPPCAPLLRSVTEGSMGGRPHRAPGGGARSAELLPRAPSTREPAFRSRGCHVVGHSGGGGRGT